MLTLPIKSLTAATAACIMLALPVSAETMKYTADLTAGSEVPPTDSSATGSADVTVDTDALTVTWIVTVDGLTGDPTAAHIHGPAAEGENAPPAIDMYDGIMDGSADITDEQLADLEAGNFYVNVHTDRNPGGEIRGQLKASE